MARHNDTGRWGEEIAVDMLVSKGYAIVQRNWRLGHLEIDIVAMKGNRIVFTEVKTRTSDDTDPLDAIDQKKISHMVRAAQAYMKSQGCELEAQFDIVAVTGTPERYTTEHLDDAFLPPLKTY